MDLAIDRSIAVLAAGRGITCSARLSEEGEAGSVPGQHHGGWSTS